MMICKSAWYSIELLDFRFIIFYIQINLNNLES